MSDPQHLGSAGALGGLSQLAIDHPRAFDVLTALMRVTPDFDPHVGYGALHGPALWCQLDGTVEEGDALLTLANDDPYILYALLKAQSHGLWTKEQFLSLDLGERPVKNALKFVRQQLGRSWGGPELTKRVNRHDRRKDASTVS